jgi:hypothetical protein
VTTRSSGDSPATQCLLPWAASVIEPQGQDGPAHADRVGGAGVSCQLRISGRLTKSDKADDLKDGCWKTHDKTRKLCQEESNGHNREKDHDRRRERTNEEDWRPKPPR